MSIFEALNERGVRYVVVGGFAVVLHGYVRLTVDLDLVVDLAPEEALKAVRTLTDLGFRPRLPEDPASFADTSKRRTWITEHDLKVFSMFDPRDPLREVDLFVEEPIPFEELWAGSVTTHVGGTPIRIAGLEHLIKMKLDAGGPRDLEDVAALKEITTMDETESVERWGWDEHRRAQIRSMARSTPQQRLEWLEDALRLALQSGVLGRAREARARGDAA